MTKIGKKTQTTLAVVAALVLLAAGYTGLCVFRYVEPPLPLAIIASWAIQKSDRPVIVDWDITREDWNDPQSAHEKINMALQKAFPPGTQEADFVAALRREGFRFPRPRPNDCVRTDHRLHCVFPSEVLGQKLVYEWGGLPCGESVSVTWSHDDRGSIHSLDGRYGWSCL